MMTLTDSQLETLWHRAMLADDRSMIEIVERALDGDDACRQIAARSARDVEIYAVALRGIVA